MTAEQVWCQLDGPVFGVLGVHNSALNDAKVFFATQALKILGRTQMDVGRVEPVVGQVFGNRHLPS